MTQHDSAAICWPLTDSLTLTSQEQVTPAFGVQSAEREAYEDHWGSHESRHDDAAETAIVTHTALLASAATVLRWFHSPWVDSDDKVQRGAKTQTWVGVPEEVMKCWTSTVCTLAPIMNTNLWGRRSQPGWPVSSARSQSCEVSCWATPSWPVSPGLTAAHPEHKHKHFDIVWPETSSQDPKDYVSTSKGWISQSWERAATSWVSYRAGGRALTTALLPERGASRRGRMSQQRPPACTLRGWSTHSSGAAGWSEICSKRLHTIEK